MSHRGRMKRAGRLNWALSFLLAVLVTWYIAASVGSRGTISAFTALAASLCGFTGRLQYALCPFHETAQPRSVGASLSWMHRYRMQVRSTCAIATCLWAVEVFLQLAKAMLTGGAIATMREEEKLNKDVIVLCGVCLTAACMIYSNVRLLLTARRCGRWIEGRSRAKRHARRGHTNGESGTAANPLH